MAGMSRNATMVRMPTLSKARRGTPTERNGGLLIDGDKVPLTAPNY
jgi:hypothetical protein